MDLSQGFGHGLHAKIGIMMEYFDYLFALIASTIQQILQYLGLWFVFKLDRVIYADYSLICVVMEKLPIFLSGSIKFADYLPYIL
ncbi:hypothetical protein I3842_02G044200 [Carya illinoinensis]|uniref:Uncharacterized protein n=1 Tax=Carya illinoinensis TaxID=32201 RepID=A0A922FNR9_CARIL|nr:hypothetical protein I3842_02G044200 [Carya illinoinensis]